MDDQNFTITFPFDERTGWVLLFVVILIIGSIAIFALLSVGDKKATNVEWQKHTISTLTIIFTPIWVALLALVLWSLIKIAAHFPSVTGDEGPSELRWHVLALVGLLTSLGGLLGTPLALVRIHTTERQTVTAEQGLITDRLSKAVEQLGANKTIKQDGQDVTVPNLEVRIGALFSLERIKNDSLPDHVQVMEILCSYVRENMRQIVSERGVPSKGKYHELREDIATLFKIVNRRSDRQREHEKLLLGSPIFDLSNTSFVGHNLSDVNFFEADLNNSDLSFTLCAYTNFTKAMLHSTHFEHANLFFPNFSESECYSSRFISCEINGANFLDANCLGMQILGGNCIKSYFLKTDLMNARLEPESPLSSNFFEHSNLVDAKVAGTISQGQLDICFGKRGMPLPKTLETPAHWLDGEELVLDRLEWERWLDEGDAYIPPHLRYNDDT